MGNIIKNAKIKIIYDPNKRKNRAYYNGSFVRFPNHLRSKEGKIYGADLIEKSTHYIAKTATIKLLDKAIQKVVKKVKSRKTSIIKKAVKKTVSQIKISIESIKSITNIEEALNF